MELCGDVMCTGGRETAARGGGAQEEHGVCAGRSQTGRGHGPTQPLRRPAGSLPFLSLSHLHRPRPRLTQNFAPYFHPAFVNLFTIDHLFLKMTKQKINSLKLN
jgi:hypothetical protein